MKNGPPNAALRGAKEVPVFQQQGTNFPICNRLHAISHVFANSPRLLDFFFTPDRTELAWETAAETLRAAVLHLPDDDDVTLVRIALGIWLDSFHAKISDLYLGFSHQRSDDCARAIAVLAAVNGCICQSCRQRYQRASATRSVTSRDL